MKSKPKPLTPAQQAAKSAAKIAAHAAEVIPGLCAKVSPSVRFTFYRVIRENTDLSESQANAEVSKLIESGELRIMEGREDKPEIYEYVPKK